MIPILVCYAPLISATILNVSKEVIKIGPHATITIFKNGTRVVEHQDENVLQGLQSGEDEGKALIVNKVYVNRTVVSSIYNDYTFIIQPKYKSFTVYANNQKYVHKNVEVPWFVVLLKLLKFL